MNAIKPIKLIVGILAISAISGCVNVPTEIDLAENTILVPFEQVNTTIITTGPNTKESITSVDTGKKARWGGKIVSVQNKKDVSEIEVVFFPEDNYGKPKTNMPSIGRFKAVVEGFVDPLVFEQGRLITVVGEVGEGQSGIIGEQTYLYPTLNAMGYYMWKESTNVNVELSNFGFTSFGYVNGYHNSFFNPWYDPWYNRNQRARIRVNKYNGHSQGGRVPQTRTTGSARQSAVSNTPSIRSQRQTSVKPQEK